MKTDDLLKAATPRPWNLALNGIDSHTIGTDSVNICNFAEGDTLEDSRPDAELVLRTVNSFEAMRDALKKVSALEASTKGQGLRDFSVNDLQDVYIAAREALALAEGEEPKTETLKAMEAGADRIAALRKIPAKSEIPSIQARIAKLERKLKRAGDPGECGDIQDALDHYREELAMLTE
jgi:hypothetical protein